MQQQAPTTTSQWLHAKPNFGRDFRRDRQLCGEWLQQGAAILSGMDSREDAYNLQQEMHQVRSAFLTAHGEDVYRCLTQNATGPCRSEDLVYAAAEMFPGLTPTRAEVAVEAQLPIVEKQGLEYAQAIFLSQMMAHDRAAEGLMHDSRLPLEESLQRLDDFMANGYADLGTVRVSKQDNVGYLEICNVQFLNAEDDPTLRAMEIAADLILLDPEIKLGVLRGAEATHPKYRGRRVFCSGVNLTHIFNGKLSYLFFFGREVGLMNKFYRGLSRDVYGHRHYEIEKPWVAAVEAHAVGGGCQLLLVMDYVLIEDDAFISLPARNEGFIPGLANLRLPRFVGERAARQAIFCNRRFYADSHEGRLLCDEIIPKGEMDEALQAALDKLMNSGMVSMSSNRKALREGSEPVSVFRSYMETFAIEQARCLFSPALVKNLETHWVSRKQT